MVFDGNAECYAEEPADVVGLWKQRLRWSRGNLQVGTAVPARVLPAVTHAPPGQLVVRAMWWSTLLLPAFMVVSSAALVALWWLDATRGRFLFDALWITNALGFVFTTVVDVAASTRGSPGAAGGRGSRSPV